MDAQEKKMTEKALIIMAIIVGAVIAGVLAYYVYQKERQISDMSELFALEKESLLDEYEELSIQYEGEKFSIGNDSLVALLTTEKMKVQRLTEELRTVKTTNARRISELKKELETLRRIMKNFVAQIDSLNTENQQLKKENQQVVQRYNQARTTAAQLTREKEKLTERVTLASRLEATAIQVRPVTSRGRDAKKIDKTAQLVLSFHVAKNITAPVGEKTLYVRIMRPDDDILKKPDSRTFAFEGKDIMYSMMKSIEYEGEEVAVTMYWNVEEFLSPGTYRADIFADGNLIGRKSFTLDK
jgi:3-methyladenine DNA glycosylase Tag